MRYGAKTDILDKNKVSVLDEAIFWKSDEVIKLFKK
jgi:hypothetical protein